MNPSSCQITVAFKKEKFVLMVRDDMTIREIKTTLVTLSGVPVDNQKLMYKSMLPDANTVGACALKVKLIPSHSQALPSFPEF